MFSFSVSGRAATASFRVPETHTFHQTLPLPPKTTIIGMIGAALGLPLEKAHIFAIEHDLRVGVCGSYKGLMKDLWNYRKVTGKEKNYTPEDVRSRKHFSILIREYLTDCEFTFFFGSESEEDLTIVRNAMRDPTFALTAGNSDDLLKIVSISPISRVNPEPLTQFDHTILPGDVSAQCTPVIDFRNLPVTQTVETPRVFLLPTTFAFIGEQRAVLERKPFTFVGSPITLKTPVMGYIIGDKTVTLL